MSVSLEVLLLLSLVGVCSALLTRYLATPGAWIRILDHPNERSLHHEPTPRTGGLAILLALAVGFFALIWRGSVPGSVNWIAAAAILVALISLAEDWFGIQRRYRLMAHGMAALILLGAGWHSGPLLDGPMGQVLILLLVVWMINLYNFMDGMDGFAGGMAAIGFSALALAGYRAGAQDYALWAALVACASAGFVLWNFPPARIFMGDSGSAMLGLLAAAFGLWGADLGVLPLWAAGLIFSPFIVDASVTLLRRLLAGERIWEAHRSHYYQRLVQLGWGHRKTVLRAYLLMLACAATALQAPAMQPRERIWLLAMWGAIYGLIAFKVRHMERLRGGTA